MLARRPVENITFKCHISSISCHSHFCCQLLFSHAGILRSCKYDQYLSLQFHTVDENCAIYQTIWLLPFSLQSGTDGALVIGCLVATAQAACLKQASWMGDTPESRSVGLANGYELSQVTTQQRQISLF